MTCNCEHKQEPVSRRCACARGGEQPTPMKRAIVNFCEVCDPCRENSSDVRLCAFVVPTLEEGRYYKNSFVFVEEDDSVYFITEERSEIPFGSRPKFIDNFDPTDPTVAFKNTVVYDIPGGMAHIYGPDGDHKSIVMNSTPITNIVAGYGIEVTPEGGVYTISVEETKFATNDDLQDVVTTVSGHTTAITEMSGEIDTLSTALGQVESSVDVLDGRVDTVEEDLGDVAADAELALEKATEAVADLSGKQDTLIAGDNITIQNNVISSTGGGSTSTATQTTNGLMSSKDRQQMVQHGLSVMSAITMGAEKATFYVDRYVSNNDGTSYTHTAVDYEIPSATEDEAGLMSADDKLKLDSLATVAETGSYTDLTDTPSVPQFTYTTTDPGEGADLAANHFIVVHGA